MNSSPLTKLDQILTGCDIAGPASEAEILDAETTLGVRFPPAYRSFLAKYGAVLGQGFEIAGIFKQSNSSVPPLFTDVVKLNLALRRASHWATPCTYVAIADDGCDNTFCLNLQSGSIDSSILALGPGVDNVVVANDFIDFVINLSTGSLNF